MPHSGRRVATRSPRRLRPSRGAPTRTRLRIGRRCGPDLVMGDAFPYKPASTAPIPHGGELCRLAVVTRQGEDHVRAVEPRQLERQADPPGPNLPRCSRPRRGREQPAPLPAAGIHQGGARSQGKTRRGRPRGSVPAARRGLRGELQGAQDRLHSRLFPIVPANGADPDLQGRPPGRQGRARGRPVRQAALLPCRAAGGQGIAELPRRHHQWTGIHGGRAHSRSAPPARCLSSVSGDPQFPARPARRRLCLARQCASLGVEVHGGVRRSRRAMPRSPTRSSARSRSTPCWG